MFAPFRQGGETVLVSHLGYARETPFGLVWKSNRANTSHPQPARSGINAAEDLPGSTSIELIPCVSTTEREYRLVTAPTQPVPDSVLMERMLSGDEAALSTIYDRYSAMLFGALLRILRDQQAAEEVLQDLFLQLWRNAARFDPSRGSLPAWLLVSGRNRAISRLRGRASRELLEETEGLFADTFLSPQNIEEEVSRMELRQRLTTALLALPAEQRQAVELAYFEGLTQSEIASRTGSPLGTVKTRVRTAMQSLKQILR